jgi:hypothetical protein
LVKINEGRSYRTIDFYITKLKNSKRNLVEVAGFFTFLGFFVEPQYFIDDFYVGEQHTSATVPFQA